MLRRRARARAVPDRHDDRGAARGAHRRRDRALGRLLLVRHQRPHADDLRALARRRRRASCPTYLESGHPRRRPVRVDRRGGHRRADRARRRRRGAARGPSSSSASAASTAAIRRASASARASGLDYVSCSPFRVPIARLAAAQAALQRGARMMAARAAARSLAARAALAARARAQRAAAAPRRAERGAVAVAPEVALALRHRVEGFYLRLAHRRFDTLETYNDFIMRDHFASQGLFFDYYADLAEDLARAALRAQPADRRRGARVPVRGREDRPRARALPRQRRAPAAPRQRRARAHRPLGVGGRRLVGPPRQALKS